MNYKANSFRRSQHQQGISQVEQLALIVTVSLAGLLTLGSLGTATRDTISGNSSASVASQSPATPTLTSRASAVLGRLSDLANLARARVASLPEQLGSPTAYREAIEQAQTTDVHETAARLREVRGANDNSQALNERLDAIERVAYGTHAPELERGLLGGLRRLFQGDLAVQAHVDDVLAQRGELIDNVKDAPPAWNRWRAAWVPLINHSKRRRLVMQALEDDATLASDGLWSSLLKQEGFFDQLTIGGGVLGSHAQGVLGVTHEAPTRLLVDASARPGSANFLQVGDALRYNQSNRGQTRFRADGRFINELENRALIEPGIVNPADLSFGKWAPGRDWADAAAVNLRASGSDVLSSTTVKGVFAADAGKPGRYRVAIERNGEAADVYTNKVLITTGLNRQKYPGLDKRSIEIIEAERAKFDPDDPTKVPVIMSAFDELEMAGAHPSWWNNYAFDPADPDATIAIIGAGDTTFTVLEQVARTLGAPEVSNLQRAQRGGGKSMGIEVFGGRSLPEDPQEFLLGRAQAFNRNWRGLRSRYAGLFGNVVRADKNRNTFTGTGAETTLLRSDNVTKIRIAETGEVEVTYRGFDEMRPGQRDRVELTKRYKRVIFATGVESDVGSLVDSFVPKASYEGQLQKTNLLDVIDAQGNVLPKSAIGADDRAVARKVPDEEIYFGGLAAGQDLIPESETVGNVQNRVSVALWAERLGRLLRDERFGESAGIEKPRVAAPPVQAVRVLPDGGGNFISIPEAKLPALTRRQEVNLALEDEAKLALEYEFLRSFDRKAFDQEGAVPVVGFQWRVIANGQRLLEIRANFDSGRWFGDLRKDGRLLGMMRKLARESQPQYIVANTYSKEAKKYGFTPGAIRPESVGTVAGMN